MNKPQNTETINVRDLNANDTFYVPGVNTAYVCESRRTIDNYTRVVYRMSDYRGEFVKVNLSTIYRVVD